MSIILNTQEQEAAIAYAEAVALWTEVNEDNEEVMLDAITYLDEEKN